MSSNWAGFQVTHTHLLKMNMDVEAFIRKIFIALHTLV